MEQPIPKIRKLQNYLTLKLNYSKEIWPILFTPQKHNKIKIIDLTDYECGVYNLANSFILHYAFVFVWVSGGGGGCKLDD